MTRDNTPALTSNSPITRRRVRPSGARSNWYVPDELIYRRYFSRGATDQLDA